MSLAYLETMRSFILAAEAKPLRAASGLALPDPALAWEYACDSFGSRQLLFEMFNVAGLNQ